MCGKVKWEKKISHRSICAGLIIWGEFWGGFEGDLEGERGWKRRESQENAVEGKRGREAGGSAGRSAAQCSAVQCSARGALGAQQAGGSSDGIELQKLHRRLSVYRRITFDFFT